VQPNALALEYQRDYGTAHGDLNVLDLVNNPAANGKCRIFCLSFPEKGADLFFRDAGSLSDDRTNPFLVTQDSV
jgi:hypothetical protein